MIQRLPHRGRQVLFAEAVPNLQPLEQSDGLLPHLSILGTEQLSAQRRHAQPSGFDGFCDGLVARLGTRLLRDLAVYVYLRGANWRAGAEAVGHVHVVYCPTINSTKFSI